MGVEMTAVDMLSPFQIEPEDYVLFRDVNGNSRSGMVLAIEDKVNTFTITLSDDEEGAADYEIDSESLVALMTYEQVSV